MIIDNNGLRLFMMKANIIIMIKTPNISMINIVKFLRLTL